MVFMDSLLNESIPEEIKKEERLSATTNTGNDLDHTVSIGILQQVQIMFFRSNSIVLEYIYVS